MTTATKSAYIIFPANDQSTVERISHGMGWHVVFPNEDTTTPSNMDDKERILLESFGAWEDSEDDYPTESLYADVKKMMNGEDFINKYL